MELLHAELMFRLRVRELLGLDVEGWGWRVRVRVTELLRLDEDVHAKHGAKPDATALANTPI